MGFAAGVIGTFKTGTYQVQRAATGTLAFGDYTPSSPSTFNADASIQPLTGRDLKDLKEGQRAEEMYVVFCTQELRTRTPTNDPDIIVIDGDHYRVDKVKRRRVFGDYWRAVVERIEVP